MLQEWIDKYYDFFGKELPEIIHADADENKLIELIKKAIYIDLKPLTVEDIGNIVGQVDIVDESSK